MVKLVDTRDLKSLEGNFVPVQVRPWAPSNMNIGIYDINEEAYLTQYLIFSKFSKNIFFLSDSNNQNITNEKLLPLSELSNSEIIKLLEKNDIKKVIFFSHRIPDVILANEFQKKNIETIYVQHGYYEIKAMKRTLKGVLRKIDKIKLFLKRIFTSQLRKKNLLSLLISLFNHWILLKPFLKNFSSPFSRVFVFDERWKNFHVNVYRAIDENIFIMGPLDVHEKFDLDYYSEKPCYVCQSLYEDGRIDLSDLNKTLNSIMAEYVKDEILIKYHPRSDKKIYQKHFPLIKEVSKIPNTNLVLGHYSSLLISSKMLGMKTIVVPLENHEIPESFISIFENTSTIESKGLHPYKKILEIIGCLDH